MVEFILPILNPSKPKRLNVTMANTMFGAMSGVRPVNGGRLIQEYVEQPLPHIGRQPSFFPPYILHIYHQHRLHQQSKGRHVDYCGGRSHVQARSGNRDYGSQNQRFKRHRNPQATFCFGHSEISKAGLTSATPGCLTKPGTPLARH